MASYSERFYSYTTAQATRSASVVCPLVWSLLRPQSVLDVGCGQGAWLSEWLKLGPEVHGVDFPEAATGLLIPSDFFTTADLTEPLTLGRKFDLAQCLEVAEHLPQASAATLVANLARASDVVFFSAAPPGQGGENHLNEQPYEYWRNLWDDLGYSLYDCLRSRLNSLQVTNWYRYNVFVFANAIGAARLPEDVLRTAIPRGAVVPDISPTGYKIRKSLVRRIPPRWQNVISRAVARAR